MFKWLVWELFAKIISVGGQLFAKLSPQIVGFWSWNLHQILVFINLLYEYALIQCFVLKLKKMSVSFRTKTRINTDNGVLFHTPKIAKILFYVIFLNLATFLVNGQKIENLNFCNFLGCRIPKNLILRLFCIVNFFDISLLSWIKHPKNHIFAKYKIIFLPWTTFWVGVL